MMSSRRCIFVIDVPDFRGVSSSSCFLYSHVPGVVLAVNISPLRDAKKMYMGRGDAACVN